MLDNNILLLKGIVNLSSGDQVKLAMHYLIQALTDEDLPKISNYQLLDIAAQVLLTGHAHLTPSEDDEAGDTLTTEFSIDPEDVQKYTAFMEWLGRDDEKED